MSFPEVPLPERLERSLNLARTAPKIPISDRRVYEWLEANFRGEPTGQPDHSPQQFGNNYFLLFLSLKRQTNSENLDQRDKSYLEKAQGLDGWDQFVRENHDLLQDIFTALELVETYIEIRVTDSKLLKKGKYEESTKLLEAANHPLSYEAVGMFAWDRLGKQLKRAATAMEKSGINPKIFYG